ncbi:hypothetical protein, partial [Candidatus Parabeggiatoa sp. HSG14]|uniref:hypothetical protein n=1 Tax=Candidatus Parabeggiatoa sp. HSG14 TaxID=3055593 RepID=UPI0025A76AEE|nr:hypothetical protein [Thiotrichales bacterium HSG14]
MPKRLFLPQRYLQNHNDIVTPQGQMKGRREWIMSRRMCHYRLFDLTDIPMTRRDGVLQLKIQQWSPFKEYASYEVWQGGQIQVWIWDKQRQHKGLVETGIKKATILPETILRPHPTIDTVQFLQCLEGFEGQVWKGGILVGSRWWIDKPKIGEWINFQRIYGLSTHQNFPPTIECPLLERPWGRTKTHFDKFYLYQEQVWVMLGIAFFTILLTWQTVSIWKWQQAATQLQTQVDELTHSVGPILMARTQALDHKNKLKSLLDLNLYPSQIELITQVAEAMPRKNTKLIEWFYQMGKLRFTIETNKPDPTFYIKTFQKNPLFKEIEAKTGTGRKINQITISVQLVSL